MNDINETSLQTVYYWQDGYYITDQEEAELLDSINAFGSEHRALEVPEGEDAKQAVNQQLQHDSD